MKVSTKGDYGVRALVELAHHYGEGRPMQSAEIAARQRIPESYLDQLLTSLRRAGFIRSVRGPQGGHALIRDPHDLRLSRGRRGARRLRSPHRLPGRPEAPARKNGGCAQRDMWAAVRDAVLGVLDSINDCRPGRARPGRRSLSAPGTRSRRS